MRKWNARPSEGRGLRSETMQGQSTDVLLHRRGCISQAGRSWQETAYGRQKMSQTCPFCPRRANSREHIYAQWITRRYTKEASSNAFFTMRFGGLFPDREARTLNVTIKVCASCNNGWMSRLENEARPLLEDLVEGRPQTLDVEGQHRLALWWAKNAVLHDYLKASDDRVVTHHQRALLRTGRLPDGWQVLLGVMGPGHGEWHHTSGAVTEWRWGDGTFRGRACLHTTAFRRLAAQVLVHTLDINPTFDRLLGGPEWSVRIWPSSGSVSWPPPRQLLADWLAIVTSPS